MEEEREGQNTPLLIAGVVQLVSGLLNLLFVSWVASFFYGGVGATVSTIVMAICTLGLCPLPIGGVCAFVWVGIVPIAIFEIVAGSMIIAQGENMKVLLYVAGVLELLSLLLGNPVAVVAGLVSLLLAVTS